MGAGAGRIQERSVTAAPAVADAVSPVPESGTVLAFDYGEKRIGVAVGELSLKIAHPLTTLIAESDVQRWAAVLPLVAEWQPVLFVVGLPGAADGVEHPVGRRCRKFAQGLAARLGIPAVLIDERLSSWAGEQALREAGARFRGDKGAVDQAAAQQILKSYFDHSGHGIPA